MVLPIGKCEPSVAIVIYHAVKCRNSYKLVQIDLDDTLFLLSERILQKFFSIVKGEHNYQFKE